MKTRPLLLAVMLASLLSADTLAWADTPAKADSAIALPDENKSAAAWLKRELARRKKGLALLRKVKDEASADAAAQQFIEIWGLEGTEGQDTWAFNPNVSFADVVPKSLDGETLYKKGGKKLLKISNEAEKILTKLDKKGLVTKDLEAAATILFYAWEQ